MPTTPNARRVSVAAVIATAVTAANVLRVMVMPKSQQPRLLSKPLSLLCPLPKRMPTGPHAATSASLWPLLNLWHRHL